MKERGVKDGEAKDKRAKMAKGAKRGSLCVIRNSNPSLNFSLMEELNPNP
jgi:hypothetical protein